MKIRSYCNTRNMGIKDLAENDMHYCTSRDSKTKAITFQLRTWDNGNRSYIVEMDENEARQLMQNIHDSLFMWDNTVTEIEKELFRAGKWIHALKEYRIRTGTSLKTAKMWADEHRNKYN